MPSATGFRRNPNDDGRPSRSTACRRCTWSCGRGPVRWNFDSFDPPGGPKPNDRVLLVRTPYRLYAFHSFTSSSSSSSSRASSNRRRESDPVAGRGGDVPPKDICSGSNVHFRPDVFQFVFGRVSLSFSLTVFESYPRKSPFVEFFRNDSRNRSGVVARIHCFRSTVRAKRYVCRTGHGSRKSARYYRV